MPGVVDIALRPVTSLGHQVGRRVFSEGPKFFELPACTVVLNYAQHIFLRVTKKILGVVKPPVYGPDCTVLERPDQYQLST